MVDREFEPLSGQAIDYETGICCVSAKHAALRVKEHRLDCLGIRLSGATCLPVDCCLIGSL